MTQLSTLKLWMGIPDTADDELLKLLISGVSVAAEKAMDRIVLTKAGQDSYSDYFCVQSGERLFRLRAYPVSAVVSVWSCADDVHVWDSTTLLASTEYWLEKDGDNGVIWFQTGVLLDNVSEGLKVTYRGGMAATAAAFETAYADIAQAIRQQIKHEWVARKSAGATSFNTATGSLMWAFDEDWLPEVKAILTANKRKVLV